MALNQRKVIRLIGLMNDKSGFRIPPLPPVIKCFQLAMDKDVLEYLLRVGVASHTVETLEDLYRTMRATGELSDARTWPQLWDEILSMCFLIPCEEGAFYELAPIFPGWLEMSTAGPRTPKNVAILEAFMEFWEFLKLINIGPIRAYMDGKALEDRDAGRAKMATLTSVTPGKKRVVSVEQPLSSQQEVLPASTVFHILEQHKDQIAVMNCICRSHKELSGGSECQHDIPLQRCMPVGRVAQQLVEHGIARPLSYQEAVELMEEFERKGCIHTAFRYGNDADRETLAICNCCSDCCLLYGGFRQGYLSMIQVKAFNKPQVVNADNCIGCNKCAKACPTLAIKYDKAEKRLKFDYDSCVGCGQCVTQCPFDVQKMVPDQRPVFVKSQKRSASL